MKRNLPLKLISTPQRLRWIAAAGASGVVALLCAVLMITSRKPVYAALWFALVTFSTCGLFLLQSAPIRNQFAGKD